MGIVWRLGPRFGWLPQSEGRLSAAGLNLIDDIHFPHSLPSILSNYTVQLYPILGDTFEFTDVFLFRSSAFLSEVEDAFERALQRQEHARYVDFLELLGDQSTNPFLRLSCIRLQQRKLSELSSKVLHIFPVDSTFRQKFNNISLSKLWKTMWKDRAVREICCPPSLAPSPGNCAPWCSLTSGSMRNRPGFTLLCRLIRPLETPGNPWKPWWYLV